MELALHTVARKIRLEKKQYVTPISNNVINLMTKVMYYKIVSICKEGFT